MKLISKKDGLSYPLIAAIALGVFLILTAAFEVIRLNIIAASIRDKFQDAIVHMAAINYGNIYTGVREGYSGDYELDGYSWSNTGYADKDLIAFLLNMDLLEAEKTQLALKDIAFSVTPAPLAPSNNSQKFTISGELTAEIPLAFSWTHLPPIEIKIAINSEWNNKF